MFDPDQFLETIVNDSNDTKLIPIPIGEYVAIVESLKLRPWTKKTDSSVSGLALDLIWLIDDPALKEQLGREKVTIKQGIMLDLTEAGTMDMGKGRNISLGRLREATDLNAPGQPFSFKMFIGHVAKINVTHRVDGQDIFSEVKAVAHI